MQFLLLSLALLGLSTWSALAQDSTEAPAESATAEQPADGQPAEETAPPPPPEFNGSASGTVIGAPLNAQVVCTIQGDNWTVQSDPGETPNDDTDGDGNIVNITANQSSGTIALNVLAGGLFVSFQDTGARFEGNTMRYAITASITGGDDERIDIEVVCS